MKTARQKTVGLICGMVACGIFAGVQLVQASVVTESFNYPDGAALAGQNGGTGWNGAWYLDTSHNATITTTNEELNFVSAGTNASTSDIWRDFADPVSSGTVYLSARMQNQNAGGRYFGLKAFSSGSMLFGQGSGHAHWMIDKVTVGTNTFLESSVITTNEALLVMKVEFDAGTSASTDEMVTFWVNPDTSVPVWQLDAVDAVGGQSYESTVDYGSMSKLRVVSGGYSSTYGYTNFTADDIGVVPEPATLGLFGIFGLGVIAFRRLFRR